MREREQYWRRFTRAAWLLLIPAILGWALGAEGIWAAGLAALGPGMGRGAARARRLRESQAWGAGMEGLASAILASLVATVSAVLGPVSVTFWMVLVAWRAVSVLRWGGLRAPRGSLRGACC